MAPELKCFVEKQFPNIINQVFFKKLKKEYLWIGVKVHFSAHLGSKGGLEPDAALFWRQEIKAGELRGNKSY